MDTFSLGFLHRPGLFWGLALVASLAAALYGYARLLAPLSSRTRMGLRLLRAAALLLLLGLLLEPLLTLRGADAGRPRLAVLLDHSSSMRLPAEGGATRAEVAEAAWARMREAWGDRFDLSVYRFADELEPLGPPSRGESRSAPQAPGDSLGAPQGATALGEALEGVLVQQGEARLGAIVLVTDGVSTAGRDPVGISRALPVPIHALVVGDSAPPADLLLREVVTAPVAQVGEPLAVRATLEARGLPGREVTLTLREREAAGAPAEEMGRELARRVVRTGASGVSEAEVLLEFSPGRAGLALLELSAETQEPEAVTINNRRLLAVDVRARKTQLLYLEGEPDWDFAFLQRALRADTTLAHHIWLRRADGSFQPYAQAPARAGGPPRTAAELADFAAVIVGHLAPDQLPAGFAAALHEHVRGGGGALFLAGGRGEDLEGWVAAGWEELLPLRAIPQPLRGYALCATRVEPAGQSHEVTTLAEDPLESERLWAALPPLWLPEGTYAVAPGASLLLTARAEEPAREFPLLAVSRPAAGRVAVLTGRGTWRWDFVMRMAGEGSWAAREFWMRMSRWLSEEGERDRFLVRPQRPVFQDGEPLEFTARLRDEEFRPVADARVTLALLPVDEGASAASAGTGVGEDRDARGSPGLADSGRRVERIDLFPEATPGHYRGTLAALPPGAYRYRAEARAAGGRPAGWQAEGGVWVEPMGPEFIRLASDPALPAHLAQASGGVSLPEGRIEELLQALPHGVRATEVVRQAELWNHWVIFALVTLLLALEWIVRRRQGLA